MRQSNDEHRRHDWWVHDYAKDFDLLDVWQYPVEGSRQDFDRFVELHDVQAMVRESSAVVRFLFALRAAMGRWFGWDSSGEEPAFREVHRSDRELVLRTSNATVTALLHLGWVRLESGSYTAQLAVYVIPKGAFGRAYMALIGPFRHGIVYPALMQACRARWQREQGLSAASA